MENDDDDKQFTIKIMRKMLNSPWRITNLTEKIFKLVDIKK